MLFNNHFMVGWKEWAKLPGLNIPFIKVKIDTGAKTSALHAYDLQVVKQDGKTYAKFSIHPIQRNDSVIIHCSSEIIDFRMIKSSNGIKEARYVIWTPIQIGNQIWDIETTLTNRDIMNHRMLLGRKAMQDILVHPAITFHQGKVSKRRLMAAYNLNL